MRLSIFQSRACRQRGVLRAASRIRKLHSGQSGDGEKRPVCRPTKFSQDPLMSAAGRELPWMRPNGPDLKLLDWTESRRGRSRLAERARDFSRSDRRFETGMGWEVRPNFIEPGSGTRSRPSCFGQALRSISFAAGRHRHCRARRRRHFAFHTLAGESVAAAPCHALEKKEF